ncbi:MAG: response regulator [Alphaproteobacteria bacterium]|nr:response regulator [Alphaproteobacteria bacterium]
MEPLNGRDFARLIRTARASPNPMVPIIMLTGHTQAQYGFEARDAGFTEYLVKPVPL